MRRLCTMLLLSLPLALPVPRAAAAVPSAANSTLPGCLALCPMGDLPFAVVVRDFANNPIVGSTVVIDFSQCPGANICTTPFWPPDPYVVDLAARTLRAATNVSGAVAFPARVGGTGGAGGVRVFADGVLLRTYALASTDQDGDGIVGYGTGTDDTMFAAKFGTSDPTADFDCDGVVGQSDQLVFNLHHSQSCAGWIDPAQKRTWGEIKVHYR
jgi:hypothetical protein